jgi:hypothetical protein
MFGKETAAENYRNTLLHQPVTNDITAINQFIESSTDSNQTSIGKKAINNKYTHLVHFALQKHKVKHW